MGAYETALDGLNTSQRKAVETIDGPLLVIAGPGTGKTQLLGVRVAHILSKTDIPPHNILCLTFTENGAENMRERLSRFIGKTAYDVNISTYHAFGGDLIRRFPEVFSQSRLESPVDELGKYQIIKEIIDNLPYDNPLKQTQHHPGDLISTISEVKRGLLSADDLRRIATENQEFLQQASEHSRHIFAGITSMPRKLSAALELFGQLHTELATIMPAVPTHAQFGSLAGIAIYELQTARTVAFETDKTTTLTDWKNKWLVKNAANEFVFGGQLANRRLEALANVFEEYEAALQSRGWYDFDDMILRAVNALSQNDDLRYTLQEQYQYILLDEFQDTNAAQFELVRLLSDNPVHEGRPNIMAVGDDDQAIYAFQGAQYSNMADFYNTFKDVKIVCLTDNYRSSSEILSTAHRVAGQIAERLAGKFQSIEKSLTAIRDDVLSAKQDSGIERHSFQSDIAEYAWVAERIHMLIESGVKAKEIAILSPKHTYLESIVSYLSAKDIKIRYEKREDILSAPVIRHLIQMSRLVMALASEDEVLADSLWKEVLSYDFWGNDTASIWQLSWQVQGSKQDNRLHWTRALLESQESRFVAIAELFTTLALGASTETCEKLLDYLIGSDTVRVAPERFVRSPLREYYTGDLMQKRNPGIFYETVSHLTELRERLRDYTAAQGGKAGLEDLLDFVSLYEQAGQRMQSTSPYNQQADAVQLMSVFKAKGLEFDHVFLIHCQDTVWGSSARTNQNKLTLPANLAPIRHAGASEDERLRLLFVAITRARHGLHLSSFEKTYSGKDTRRLKYFDEQEQDDGSIRSLVLPEGKQLVNRSDAEPPELSDLERSWQDRHLEIAGNSTLQELLSCRLTNYQISPTHITKFIDVEYAGPGAFFFDVLLGFPQAPSVSSQFGDMMHETMEWVQQQTTKNGAVPSISETKLHFASIVRRYQLPPTKQADEIRRGEVAIELFLTKNGHIFSQKDKAEQNFRNEGVFIGSAHMAGKIDRLEIDEANKTITIVDFKTGRSYNRWASKSALYKYELQLYCYKLLVEHSHSYRGYHVIGGRLEFLEPDDEGEIHTLALRFDENKTAEVEKLIEAIWRRIHNLDFPDISGYEEKRAGILAFVEDLVKE